MNEDGLEIWRSGRISGVGGITPTVPAIVLDDPKYPHNVGQIVRLASCYGIPQVWFTGDRIALDEPKARGWNGRRFRLPREERMRGYEDVTLINHPDPISRIQQAVPRACPVAVELRPNAELLPDFLHPFNLSDGKKLVSGPIYVFGPEDGSLDGSILKRCHRFIVIPSFQCLNLSQAVNAVLYDRMVKSPRATWPSAKGRGREEGNPDGTSAAA